MCKKRGINTTTSIQNYKQNKDYNILKIFEAYDYDKKNTELEEFFSELSLMDYKYIFKILKNIENNQIKTDDWKIQNSIVLLFKYIINNKVDILNQVFIYYLNYDCPFKSYPNYLFLLENKEEIVNILIKSKSDSKYFFLKFLWDLNIDKKYLNNVKNFIKSQKNIKNKYTLNLSTIIKYSMYDSSIIEEYTNEIIESDDINLIIDYTNCLNENFDEINNIYNSFTNKIILENLYLKIIDSHVDYNGYMGFLLVKNNFKFLKEIVKIKCFNHIYKIDKIIENIWNDTDPNKLISNIYNEILESNFGYLDLHHLFNYSNDKIKKLQNEWLKEYIGINKQNKEKIKYLFYVICERDNESKKELILWLLEVNSDIEIFKSVQIFSHSKSWSNSRMPLIERKIDFLNNLKDEIVAQNDITYIPHINYLSSMVDWYKEEIKRTKTEEYLDDFYN